MILAFVVAAGLAAAPQAQTPPRDSPAVQKAHELELRNRIVANPADIASHHELAKLLEAAGRGDEAEQLLIAVKGQQPGEADSYVRLASFYQRQGKPEKMIAVLKERAAVFPSDPQALYMLETSAWDAAYRNTRLPAEKRAEFVEDGLDAANRAIALNADHLEAVVYKGLLLRLKATIVTGPAQQQALVAEAQQLQDRIRELQRKTQVGAVAGGRAASTVTPPGAPPPPPPPGAVRVGGNVRPPVKIVDAPPVYPPEAHAARIQGIVILEVTIAPEGHIQDARILRSIPLLDQAAIDAVRQWMYTPTLLNGQPVAVIMTVTVNFALPG